MLAVLENANTARTQVCIGSNPVLTTKTNNMKKLETILMGMMILFAVLSITMWVIGVLWNTPNEGIIHNLFRISALGNVVSLGLYLFTLYYNEEIKQK